MEVNKKIVNFKDFSKEEKVEELDESVKYSYWELESKINKILSSNIQEIPYEGKEIDTYSITAEIIGLIREINPDVLED